MSKTKAAVMYHCDECGGPITAKAGDAVHKVGSRTLGECCIGKPTPAKAPRVDGRKAAAAARWANMTADEKAARVTKMQAGRRSSR